MAKYKPKIVLSLDVWKKIRWFTKNLTTEIGAVGTMEIREDDGEKYFYVEKLFFPKQTVSVSTVHFTGEMWGELVKEASFEDLQKIGFYWHRHPSGSPHHSHTDDEDTFEVFMSKDCTPQRQYFAFLQTAWKDNGVVFEGRIDIRRPIRATILDDNIQVLYEIEPKDQQLEEECLAIKERCIVTPPPINHNFSKSWKPNDNWATKKDINRHATNQNTNVSDATALKALFGNYEVDKERFYIDNDMLNGVPTSEEEKCSLEFVNGQVTIVASQDFQGPIIAATDVKGSLYKVIRQMRQTDLGKGRVRYNIQPKAGSYAELCKITKDIFYNYNKLLSKKLDVTEPVIINTGSEKQERQSKYKYVGDPAIISSLIEELSSYVRLDWKKDSCSAIVYEIVEGKTYDFLGSLTVSPSYEQIECFGYELCELIKNIVDAVEQDMSEEFVKEETKKNIDEIVNSVAADTCPTTRKEKKNKKDKKRGRHE